MNWPKKLLIFILILVVLFITISASLLYSFQHHPKSTFTFIDRYFIDNSDFKFGEVKNSGSFFEPIIDIDEVELIQKSNGSISNINNIKFSINTFQSILGWKFVVEGFSFDSKSFTIASPKLLMSSKKTMFEDLIITSNDRSLILNRGTIFRLNTMTHIKSDRGFVDQIIGEDIDIRIDPQNKLIEYSSIHDISDSELEFISSLTNFNFNILMLKDGITASNYGTYDYGNKIFNNITEISNLRTGTITFQEYQLQLTNGLLKITNFSALEGSLDINFDDQSIDIKLLGESLRSDPYIEVMTSIFLDTQDFYQDSNFLSIKGRAQYEIIGKYSANKQETVFSSNLKGIEIYSPLSYLEKSKDEILDTSITLLGIEKPSIQIKNKKVDAIFSDISSLQGKIFIGESNKYLDKPLASKTHQGLHLYLDLPIFNILEIQGVLEDSANHKQSLDLLKVWFHFQELLLFDNNFVNQEGEAIFQNNIFRVDMNKGSFTGSFFNDASGFLRLDLKNFKLFSNKSNLNNNQNLIPKQLNLRLTLTDSQIDRLDIEDLSVYIQKSGTKLGINKIILRSNLINIIPNDKYQENFLLYDSHKDLYVIHGVFILNDLSSIPFLTSTDDFRVGYANLDFDLQFNDIKNIKNIEGSQDILLKDLSWSGYLPNSRLLNLMGILNLKNIIGKVSNLDLSLDEYAVTEIDRLDGEFIFNKSSMRLPKTLSLETNAAKMKWDGKVYKNNSGELENLDLTLDLRFRVAENIPWYAGIFAGLPAAAGSYILGEVFEEDINNFSTLNFEIKGTLEDPVVIRID